MKIKPGHPYPLGADLGRRGETSPSSRNTPRRSNCACSTRPTRRRNRSASPARADRPGLARLPARTSGPGQLYGYRVHGPYEPAHGHRFNPNKVLLDPYAKAIGRDVRWDDALFGYKLGDPEADLSFDDRDSAAVRAAGRRWSTRPSPGATTAAPHALAQDAHLRGARQGLHQAASRRARDAARHLRRAGLRAGRSSTCSTWASPRSSCCRSITTSTTATWSSKGLSQLLGLQHARLLRPRPALRDRRDSRTPVREFKIDGPRPCTPRASR